MRRRHVARRRWEETSYLNQVGTIQWERRENKGKKKEEKERRKERRKEE